MKRILLFLAVLPLALACTPYPPPDEGNDSSCTGICDSVFNFGNPNGPTASPSPGAGGTITRVAIASFGEEGPNPVAPDTAQVRVGNTERLTCTPKMQGPSGNEIDAPPSVHGPQPDVFAVTSGSFSVATFNQDDDEPFNGSLKGVGPGQVTMTCVVKGVRLDKVYTVVR